MGFLKEEKGAKFQTLNFSSSFLGQKTTFLVTREPHGGRQLEYFCLESAESHVCSLIYCK